jgi:hypothetical protein
LVHFLLIGETCGGGNLIHQMENKASQPQQFKLFFIFAMILTSFLSHLNFKEQNVPTPEVKTKVVVSSNNFISYGGYSTLKKLVSSTNLDKCYDLSLFLLLNYKKVCSCQNQNSTKNEKET